MIKRVLMAAAIASAAVPLMAQAPAGWKVRIDRSQNAADPDNVQNVQVMAMGNGFHVIGGPAGTYYNSANTATGDFTLSASFNLMEPSDHTNYYGLVFGGDQMEGPNQNYIYFMVAQDGTYMIKHRAGADTHVVQNYTPDEVVKKPGADGRSSNMLEVRVAGNTISYVVNGKVVKTTPKSGMTAKTDGVVGVRVNHLLNVHIDAFTLKKM